MHMAGQFPSWRKTMIVLTKWNSSWILATSPPMPLSIWVRMLSFSPSCSSSWACLFACAVVVQARIGQEGFTGTAVRPSTGTFGCVCSFRVVSKSGSQLVCTSFTDQNFSDRTATRCFTLWTTSWAPSLVCSCASSCPSSFWGSIASTSRNLETRSSETSMGRYTIVSGRTEGAYSSSHFSFWLGGLTSPWWPSVWMISLHSSYLSSSSWPL